MWRMAHKCVLSNINLTRIDEKSIFLRFLELLLVIPDGEQRLAICTRLFFGDSFFAVPPPHEVD